MLFLKSKTEFAVQKFTEYNSIIHCPIAVSLLLCPNVNMAKAVNKQVSHEY